MRFDTQNDAKTRTDTRKIRALIARLFLPRSNAARILH